MPDHQRSRHRVVNERVNPPEVYAPAMPPLALIEAVVCWARARRRRRALRQLLELDGHLLHDIGVSRERVIRALRRGPSVAPGAGETGRGLRL